jgi:manganese transport protein
MAECGVPADRHGTAVREKARDRMRDRRRPPSVQRADLVAGMPAAAAVSGRSRRRWRIVLAGLGPAFLVSVGYMDPGNWATNIEAGSRYGYALLWVLFASNLMAILLQSLAAKLGITSGLSLPEASRRYFPPWLNLSLWLTAEAAALATDLAEVLGAALGFYLLFRLPMMPAAVLAGMLALGLLWLYRFGYRPVELAILALIGVVGGAFLIEVLLADPDWSGIAVHVVHPELPSDSVLVAAGMLGATVMPHNIYLHSAVVRSRIDGATPRAFLTRLAITDSLLALDIAWLVNSAMVIVAASVFFAHGVVVTSIEEAHAVLGPLLGGTSALVFAVALIAAGISSSATATLAGQVIMDGFVRTRLSPFFRRLITLAPALIVIALGVNPYWVLILSQVALSLQLPFAIVPLVYFTASRRVLGEYRNGAPLTAAAATATLAVVSLNGYLLLRLLPSP